MIKVLFYAISIQLNGPFKTEHMSEKCQTDIIGSQSATLPVLNFSILNPMTVNLSQVQDEGLNFRV